LQQKAFLNKARDEIEKVDTGSTFQSVKNIKSIKPVRAPRKNAETDAEQGLLTPSRSGIILDTYENFFKENSESRKTVAEIESRHREELIKRDREIANVNLQLQHEKQKKQDSSAIHNLKVEIEREKKARHAAEKRLEGDVAALKSQHKTKVAELSDLYEKKFSESWKRREDKEKRQAEIAAAKLRDEEEKLQQAKLAKREKLEAKAKQLNDGILQLINREWDGTLALTQDSEILSQSACLDGLVDLWKSNGTTLCSILPHRLMNDLDYALEFEVEVIITARVYMLNLQLRGFEPKELLGTNWSPSAIDRFKNGLVPYHYDTELSDMSVAVCNIHQILQQAVAGMRASQLTIATCEQHFAPPAGSDNATSPQSLAIQPLFTPDLPTFKVTQPTPLIPPVNTKTWQVDSSVAPMNRKTTGYHAYVPDTIHQPPPATPSFGFTPPPVQPPPVQPPRDEQKRICLNMSKKGFCRFGNNCKFERDNGRCTNSRCRYAHMNPHGTTTNSRLDDGYDADEGFPLGNFVGNVLTNRTTWDDGRTNPFAPPPLAPRGHRSRRNNLAPSNFGYLNKSLQERITRDNDAFVPPLGPRNRIGDHPGFLPGLHDRGRNDSFNPPTGPRKRNNNNRGAGSLASRMSFTGGHPAAGLLEQASMSALGRKLGQGGNDHHRKKKGKKHGQGRRNGGGGGGGGGVMLGGEQW
jgi:hypothetical protein